MDRIAGHVFNGDGSTSTTGGRHTSDSYESANKGAKITAHNEVTHIKQYVSQLSRFENDKFTDD